MLNAALPDDPAALKALLRKQRREHLQQIVAVQNRVDTLEQNARQWESQEQTLAARQAELTARLTELQKRNDDLAMDKLRLQYRLNVLMQRYYGSRADKISTGQLLLKFAELLEEKPLESSQDSLTEPDSADSSTTGLTPVNAVTEPTRHIRKGRRDVENMKHLPIQQCLHDLPESEKACPVCQQQRQEMGRDSSWQVERIPPHFVRIEHIQVKYVCRSCEQSAAETGSQIVLADKPEAPIAKGLPGPGLLAHVVSSKFADHLPLYRLEGIFARQGFDVTRGTMCQWMTDVADLVKPVYDVMVQEVKASHVTATDDTIMPLLAPEKTKKARMWIYRGDAEHAYNVFDFTESRSRDGPATFLEGFNQTLLADAYGAYDGICVEGNMTKAGCWAHARRKFTDVSPMAPEIAREAEHLIGKLFDLERQAQKQNLDPQAHLALRQERSVPILAQLHERLLHWKATVLPKHPVNTAIGYCLNQWESLKVFTRDSAVRMDNNLAEQEMKRIALGRKNFLFVGSVRGGQTAAILASMTSTCRRHEINVELYLTQLLANLPSTPITQVRQWLPDVWKQRQLAENKSVLIRQA